MNLENNKIYTVELTWPQIFNLNILLLAQITTIKSLKPKAQAQGAKEYYEHLAQSEKIHESTLQALAEYKEEAM